MNIEPYIGIPFVDRGDNLNGADCYGIVRLIYKSELNITIPEFNSSCQDTRRIYVDYLRQIEEYWEITDETTIGSVICMAYDPQHPRIVQHFGISLGNGMMLHTLDKIGSFICKIDDYRRYIKGIYKWKKLD
jgi:cell wall-associated NlpC family hydrolase